MSSNIKAMVAEISEEYLPILEDLVAKAEQAVVLKAENSRLRATDAPADWITKQRGDLKTCPFCGTAAIEQGREAESDTGTQWRIQCGNPFCELVCQTHVFAALFDAERAWQERESIAEAENSRLREAIENAPHGDLCGYIGSWDAAQCDCWKRAALAAEVKNA